jgi:2-dehydro-3-deoxyglucarate aldolase/4-hydroxy-2-oxoheptanedioate aldolase
MNNYLINLNVMAVRGRGSAPFVRILWNDPVRVKPILEMGPAGIIFPFIKTVEEAEMAVSSCRYPPDGIRGFGPRRANDYGNMEINDYLKISRKEPLIILQIEHIKGLENLEDIVRVDGVDMIAVGPSDLSGSMGLLGQLENPEVSKSFDKIAEICRNNGMKFFPATGYGSVKGLTDWVKRGACMLALDWDIGLLHEAAKNAIGIATKAIEEANK